MQCTQIQRALVLSLFFSSAVSAETIDRIEYTLGCLFKDVEAYINGNTASCTPITQADINNGGGIYTITQPGEYCLAQDVVGSVGIQANGVSINLNFYTINAGGIFITRHSDIKISNGSIANSSGAGVSALDAESIELSNLNIFGQANDSVRMIDTGNVKIQDVNFSDGNGHALALYTCHNINIGSCTFMGYGNCDNLAVLELINCSNVLVQGVDATENCAEGIIVLQSSNSVIVSDSILNNNNDGGGGILLYGTCTDCTLIRCESNGGFFGIAALPSGSFTNLSFIECACANNHTSFVIENGVCCLVQDCRAINNAFGFVDFSDSLTTTYIGNLAQCSEAMSFYIQNGAISLQGLDWISGNTTLISGNADLGARFTNIYVS